MLLHRVNGQWLTFLRLSTMERNSPLNAVTDMLSKTVFELMERVYRSGMDDDAFDIVRIED